METATLASGCFWCSEAIFKRLKGVQAIVPGYSGGHIANPTYNQVCSGNTGHAESIQITFDPRVISFEKLLEIFFALHDPTTVNQQGADIGAQYRSVIFYHNEKQRRIAEQVKVKIAKSGLYQDPIVTKIEAFANFYPAEDYHQNYYERNSDQPYCQIVIDPKIQKLVSKFKQEVKQL